MPIPDSIATPMITIAGMRPVSVVGIVLKPALPEELALPEPPVGAEVTVPVPAVPAWLISDWQAPLALEACWSFAAPLKLQESEELP